MKKMKKICIVLFVCFIISFVNLAVADDSIIWDYNNWDYSNQGTSPSGTHFFLSTSNRVAEGTSTGNAGYDNLYTKSTWGFDADDDFGVNCKFYLNNAFSDMETVADSNLYIRFAPLDPSATGYAEFGIGNTSNGSGGLNRYYYSSYDFGSGNTGTTFYDRGSSFAGDIWLYYDYDTKDILFHKSPDGTAGSWQNLDVLNVPTVDEDIIGIEFGLRSNASGVTLPYNMDFYNINMVGKVTAAPEPISATLFLLGGAGLVAARRRKKRK